MEASHADSKAKRAEILGVSCSGYYDWLNTRKERESERRTYEELVKDVFESGEGHYGAERICGVIRKEGGSASFPVVKRIMNVNGIKSSHSRRRQRSLTDSRGARDDRYKNLVVDLDITHPFQALSSDITYIRTKEGFDYLCQIRDVYTVCPRILRTLSYGTSSFTMDVASEDLKVWGPRFLPVVSTPAF